MARSYPETTKESLGEKEHVGVRSKRHRNRISGEDGKAASSRRTPRRKQQIPCSANPSGAQTTRFARDDTR